MDVVSDAIAAVRVGDPFANRVRAEGSWCARLPAYEGAGFHVVLDGSCQLLLDEGHRPVPLGRGDVVLLPHGSEHLLADAAAEGVAAARRAVEFDRWADRPDAADPSTAVPDTPAPNTPTAELMCGKYRLDRARAHPLLAELPDVLHLPAAPDRHPELHAALGLLAHETTDVRPGADIAVPGLLDLLLVYLIRAWLADRAVAGTSGWPCALGDPVVASALSLLHTDPAHPWTNDQLAARAGVSRATLARRFTLLVGRPPMAYLSWWRMTRAAALLRDGEAPLEAIARRVGYGSPYALSHAFSREFGVTPGRYRTRAAKAHATSGMEIPAAG
ncbi:AraC family transcriptional regulator [Streptomyces flavofungini]|uniref:AraC family transcriptional regulator n=1 Tax=Streptomyces flavofungini TaxID=68200 RepID=A0ABS0X0W6_9ACTN|nr:AraC family transcriptional regulator [Streptomyces flavofungini]MBJ3806827.1 AraC family transcriptional regulator [Streptomyces flavofungini]GHC60283.1 AraC family transcriptional regulator [Streptomyces flavofungini]